MKLSFLIVKMTIGGVSWKTNIRDRGSGIGDQGSRIEDQGSRIEESGYM